MNPHTWIEIVLYVGVAQGIFLSFSLPWISKDNKGANKMLALLLFTASLSVILFLHTIVQSSLPFQTQGFLDTFPFIFGPLLYLYLRKLLFPSEKSRFPLLHFLPAVLHGIYILAAFRYSEEEFASIVSSGSLKNEWLIIFSTLTAVIFTYWAASFNLLLRFKKQAHRVVAFRKNLVFLSVFLIAVCIGYLICILFSLDFFFQIKLFAFTGTNIGWIIIPLLIYFISYNVLIQPEALKITYHIKKKTVVRINKEVLIGYQQQLEKVMEEERLYLNPSLKSQTVAGKINLDTTKFSWLINEIYGCNFYDFINKYRIEEFLQRLNNNEHKRQTLAAIAYDVGFNSKTTFNKAFKKITRYTPSEYIRNLSFSSEKRDNPLSQTG